jgi:hypothetical protein
MARSWAPVLMGHQLVACALVQQATTSPTALCLQAAPSTAVQPLAGKGLAALRSG